MLPLILELLPDLKVCFDDDTHIPLLTKEYVAADRNIKWAVLVCCGAFFLIDVEDEEIYASPQLAHLVVHFLRRTKRTVAAERTGAIALHQTYAPHAHVQLI